MRLIDADDLIIMEFGGIKFVPKEFIDNAPTIEPERKPGVWKEREIMSKEDSEDIEQWQCARCSECGRYHTTPFLYSFNDYNFCPHCGAKMSGGTKLKK